MDVKTVRSEGAGPTAAAYVRNAATGWARCPSDFILDETDIIDGSDFTYMTERYHTVTAAEYWKRDAERSSPSLPADDMTPAEISVSEPFDAYTIDAEILVYREGHSTFTTAEVGNLLGISRSALSRRMTRGTIPQPQFPSHRASDGENVPHRWTSLQVVEIVAAHRRKAASA